MRKTILISIGIGVILGGNIAAADTFIRPELLPYADQDPIVVAIKNEEKSNRLGDQIDLYLDYLLKIPFELRQYLFPGLFEVPNMPKKIRTHPEIAIWKGKMPTDIDPEKRELADKYMKDLNPTFYMFLAPKGIQEEKDMPNKVMETDLFPGEGVKVIEKVEKYPTVFEALKQSEELEKNPNLALLTPKDIQKIDLGVGIFKAYLTLSFAIKSKIPCISVSAVAVTIILSIFFS